MSSLVQSLSPHLGGFNAQKLLRRQNLRLATVISKWTASILALVLFAVTVAVIAEGFLQSNTAVEALENDIQSRITILKNPQAQPTVKPDYAKIASGNLFGKLDGGQSTASATPAPVISNVPLILIGTFLTQGEEPYAIIEDQKKSVQDVFIVNESIFEAAKLVAIHNDKVEIERNGQREILTLDDLGGGESDTADSDVVGVDEDELNKALENLPLLLTQARAVPYFKDGQSVGLRLFAIKKGSLFEKIGLTNGDILKSINGNSLGDITQAVKLFEKLKEERSISLQLERNREEKTLKYQIR